MASFVTSDGVRLDYAVDDFTDPWKPQGTLVLLHSAMGCKQRFFSWMPRLARRFRVVRLDLRGHGASQVPGAALPLTVDRLVEDVKEFLAEVGVEKAHWAGASAGGYLCQRMAMDYPDRVQTMALFGSTPGFKGGQTPTWMPLMKSKGLRNFLAETLDDRFPLDTIDPGLVEWFLDQAGGNDMAYIERFINLMDQQDWSNELVKIQCPTMVIVPGLGRIGDYSGFERMKQGIADVTFKTYENMPHNVWDSLPDRCVTDLVNFIEARSSVTGKETA